MLYVISITEMGTSFDDDDDDNHESPDITTPLRRPANKRTRTRSHYYILSEMEEVDKKCSKKCSWIIYHLHAMALQGTCLDEE